MTELIELSEDAYAVLFRPIANHLNPHASFDWGTGLGTLFETYGDELAFVGCQEPARIWTLLSGDGGDHIASGFHFVNRVGYFISEIALPESVQIEVRLDSELDLLTNQPLTNEVAESIRTIIDYLLEDEKRHFYESELEHGDSHVYQSLEILRRWLRNINSHNPMEN